MAILGLWRASHAEKVQTALWIVDTTFYPNNRAQRAYKTSLAKSARRERSPRASVMWPPCGQPLKRSTAKVKPEEPSVR
jgi:hypothetical protein